MATFVLEIGSEELPSRFLPVEEAELAARFRTALDEAAVEHGGMRVPLSKQPALLGRNASDCQLVYRDSTPGVSGQHCSLTWDAVNGVFVLTDLRSTYGTFLQNGQQLKPGVAYPLREGAVFYLGDKNNLLRLEVE